MKINVTLLKIAVILAVFLVPLAVASCKSAGEVTFDQLFATPEKYDGKTITVEGYYFQGWEVNVLCSQLKYSAPGHLIPDDKMIWVEGGLPKDIYDRLSQEQTAGPLERYGKIRLTGNFAYGGRYGHLGGYNFQLTVIEAELLYWSIPEPTSSASEGFAVYLLARDVPVAQMPALSHPELANTPLLSSADIVSYIAVTHQIELTPAATQRLVDLQVPTNGRAFLVCVDRQPIYWGAFWTPISSMSFDGIAILKPLSLDRTTIRVEFGYPSGSHFSGEDHRSDPRIIESLRQMGKLK